MKYAQEIVEEIEERSPIDTTSYIVDKDDAWENYIRGKGNRKIGRLIDVDKFLNYILTLLLKRVKVVYREYWTSKQISQIDAIIWKLDNIENFR